MKFLRIASAVALIPALFSTPAQSASLAPSGDWQVISANAQCIALRNYGATTRPTFLLFKPAPLGDVMQISVVRPGAKMRVGQIEGTIQIGNGPATKMSVLGYASGKDRVSAVNVPLGTFGAVRTAGTLRLYSSGELDHSFTLTDMAPMMDKLDRCSENLRKFWHIGEPAGNIRQQAESKAPLPTYFDSNDYPNAALSIDASGLVQMVSLIDETGKVASCMVIATSGYATLDAQSCAVITGRASFSPAIDRDGNAVRSARILRIRWQTSL